MVCEHKRDVSLLIVHFVFVRVANVSSMCWTFSSTNSLNDSQSVLRYGQRMNTESRMLIVGPLSSPLSCSCDDCFSSTGSWHFCSHSTSAWQYLTRSSRSNERPSWSLGVSISVRAAPNAHSPKILPCVCCLACSVTDLSHACSTNESMSAPFIIVAISWPLSSSLNKTTLSFSFNARRFEKRTKTLSKTPTKSKNAPY